ncbi:hypothetical protein [Actinoplanes sp. NPDC049802]|uniref:hypothetical protein n=1 Tax=Actinoplanes sp. NPDC049802 TaxID=3154742 RepID=UPI0033D1D43F
MIVDRRVAHRGPAIVPVVGGILGAGLSFNMLHPAVDDATRLYRALYLAEKHGLPWAEWINVPTDDTAKSGPVVDTTAIEIDGPLDGVAEGDGTSAA